MAPLPEQATRRRLAAAMGRIDGVLPGTVVIRHQRCGKANCACKADPPRLHGPYIQWTRTVEGKTVTRNLSAEQADRYRPWFDAARRLRELTNQLEAASLLAMAAAENWPPPPLKPPPVTP